MKAFNDNGFRTWPSQRLFYIKLEPAEDWQGDRCFRFTLHVLRRAFQFSYWYHLPLWWRKRK